MRVVCEAPELAKPTPLILPSHSGHLQHTQSATELIVAELLIMFVRVVFTAKNFLGQWTLNSFLIYEK